MKNENNLADLTIKTHKVAYAYGKRNFMVSLLFLCYSCAVPMLFHSQTAKLLSVSDGWHYLTQFLMCDFPRTHFFKDGGKRQTASILHTLQTPTLIFF
jgi:hypothetical protein